MIAVETVRNTRTSSGSPDTLKTWAITAGIGLLVAVLVSWLLITRPVNPPAVNPTPAPVVVDIGVHEALGGGGDFYAINRTYAAMSDDERDAANRFARAFPYGREDRPVSLVGSES